MKKKMVSVEKGVKLPAKKVAKIRQEAGGSNIGKYKSVSPKEFAGSKPGTFPINTKARAKAALAYAHNDPNPGKVRAAVRAKYPTLGKDKK